MTFNRITLGRTGIEVTELCLGTLILGVLQANLSPEEGAPAVRRALELGVNFIDTAMGYKTYEHVRLGMAGFRDVVIASKSPVKTADGMRKDVEDCLRALRRDTIDIFLLHLVKSADDLREREGALDMLRRFRDAGKIRAIGLSSHGTAGIRAALGYSEIDVILPILNRRGLGITDGNYDEMLALIREARGMNLGIYDMKPLAGGHLIDDIPAAIAHVRGLGVFHSIAVGLKTPEEVEIMAGVFAGDPAMIERALVTGKERAGKKRLIVYDSCKRCGICAKACAQEAISIGEKKAEVNPDKCILCGYCAAACPSFYIRVI